VSARGTAGAGVASYAFASEGSVLVLAGRHGAAGDVPGEEPHASKRRKGEIMSAHVVRTTIASTAALRGLLVLGLTSSAALAAAQPPPVGPPVNVTETGQLPVPFITAEVEDRAQAEVDETNARMEAEGDSARASVSGLQVWGPYRSASTLWDRPNSSFVRVPYILSIEVEITGFNRFIHIPIDVTVSCDAWDTSAGTVTVRSKAGPASIEGGSILEDMIHIRDYLDARVRASFSSPAPVTVPLAGLVPPCSTIGASNGGTAAVADDLIVWDVPRRQLPVGDLMAKPTVEVTFDRITRLPAHTLDGAVLYQDVEDFYLNLFANYAPRQKQLTMEEGDVVSLADVLPVTLTASKYDKLVVIANAAQPPNNPKDSGFGVGLRTQSYSPGPHSIVIPKWYWLPASGLIRKPRLVSVPAYQVDYTVRYFDPGIMY
jgi:hypothetical protein